MNYNSIRKMDISNGPGIRVSLFTQGCSIKCPGCFNSQLWDFNGGKLFTDDTLRTLLHLTMEEYIDGLTILGGEPLDNDLEVINKIIRTIKTIPHKSVWIYTGHTFESLTKEQKEAISDADFLVDGPFIAKLKNIQLKFRGSSNQRIIDIKKTLQSGKIVLWQQSL